LDTNVLVSALWTPAGNAAKIVSMIPSDTIIPCYSLEILDEYRSVLYRAKFDFPLDEVDDILSDIANYGMITIPKTSAFEMSDESDRKFYDVAKALGALLITGNKRHFPHEPFVVTPAEFLSL
jgi:putative PIN family toxin of toxin-antitoxin system